METVLQYCRGILVHRPSKFQPFVCQRAGLYLADPNLHRVKIKQAFLVCCDR